ncbi:hypothetical protein L3X38_019077 [Prunus dulcis]|uniref:Retrovirus-related Pol polyprotein from transposon TNT 1-94-like beta-barrel domain-containing protein n=1 Tax=Prunus dulcis TaxID=3755 RepID=A0AAD4ZBC2_PRUDU|nr:hypothetical protein L3X38_019077 [Prunus dulcis]
MAGSGTAELRTPVFNGENYEFWSIRMKTILKSHGLWDFVKNGFDVSDPTKDKKKIEEIAVAKVEKPTMAELLMKDARALGLIQGVVSDQIFPRIVNEETSKGAWDILKQEFRGDKQSHGEDLSRERVVQKLLISLPRSYDRICFVIEHSKDLETLEVQEVVASLKSFELKLDKHAEDSTERAFARKPKCTGCGKFGHVLGDYNGNKSIQKVTYANQVEETGDERLLVNIQRNLTSKVKMGTGEIVHVARKGTLVIETKLGRKHIQEVMLVHRLEENLLSVG